MIFKYYHGTSTIFLNSIQKHGLGGVNPNTDFKNLEGLKFLFELCEVHLTNNSQYLQLKDTTWAMVHQGMNEITDERGQKHLLHYRHDGIYVAISRVRAAIHAVLNKCGSEILEMCIELHELLVQAKIAVDIPSDIDIFNFRQFINVETKPIIIEVSRVADEELEKEDGKTATEALNLLLFVVCGTQTIQ